MKKGVKRFLAVVLSLSMIIATPIAMPQNLTTVVKAAGAVAGSYVTDFSYDFAYTTRGYADGTFRMTATEDGTYKVYWGDAAGKKLKKNGYDFTQIATVVVQDGEGSYNLVSDYTAIPAGAETVLVYKKNQLQYVYELPEEKLFTESGDSYTFGSLSDLHFGRYSAVYDDDSVEAMEHAYEFYDDIGVDFVAISGDITSGGSQSELDKYNAVLENHPNITSLTTIGNHDSRTTLSTSNTSALDTSISRWYNSISSTYYTVDEDGTVNNYLDGYPILANDALENPIDTYYREEKGGDPIETTVPGLDFVTEAGGNIFIFFNEIAQTGEAFAVDKLITTGQMDWLEEQLENYKDRNVFMYFHSFLPVNTLDGDKTDNNNCVGDLKNEGGYSYDLDFKDTVETSSGLNMQGLLTKYSNVHMLSGHSHWAYAMQDINPILNIGRLAGGKGGTLVHISSLGGPRTIGMTDTGRTELNGYASEGTTVTVYDDCIVYNSIDFYKGEYEAYATYIIPAGDNGIYEPIKNPDYKESDTAITGDEYLDIDDMTTLQILQSDYNLTLGAAYVYSSKGGENKDGALTDGKSTGSYCNTKEGKNGDQYIIITLDAEQDVSNLNYAYIYFVNGLTDSDSYNIQISRDGEYYETIGDYKNMTYKDTELELDVSAVTLEKFKYVKLNLTGSSSRNYGYQIREIALIGYDKNQTPNTANSESHVDGDAPIDESEFINTDYNLVYTADYTQSSVGGENKGGALTDGSLNGFLNTERSSSAIYQEIVIDLGTGNKQDVSNIDYFLLYSQNNDTLVTAFNVYLSEDGETYEMVGSYDDVDLDMNHFDPDFTEVTLEKFRYVKLELINGKTGYGYQIKEFAVIAKEPVEYPPVADQAEFVADEEKNIALGKTVYVSSISENEGKDPTVLTDGKADKFWSSIWDDSYTSDYIIVDLGETYDATLIGRTLINYQNANTFCEDLRIEFSETYNEEDPTEGFYEVAKTKASSWEALQRYADPNGYVQTKISDVEPGYVRYVKFQMNGHKGWGFQVKEVAIFLKDHSVEDAEIELDPTDYEYTGSEIIPNVTVVYGDDILSQETDYYLVCTNNIDVGTATVYIYGNGDFYGTVVKKFTIVAKQMSADDFDVEISNDERNQLIITVKAGDYVLEEGKDYTCEIIENEDGSLTLVFKAEGTKFAGSFEQVIEATELPANDPEHFRATSANLNEIVVSFENPSSYGASQQIYDIYIDGQLVDEGVPAGSYTYKEQAAGTHRVEVLAKLGENVANGMITDVTVHGLNIEKDVDITVEDEDLIFNGFAQELGVIVSIPAEERVLEENVDYTLTYDNNVNAGTATYTVTGINLFEGTVTGEFTIASCDINDVTLDDSNLKKEMEYNAKERTPNISLSLGDYQLQPARDYTVEYTDNVDAGTAHIIVTATDENFTGTFTKDFTILKKPLSNTNITATVNADNTVTVKITNPEAGKAVIEGVDYAYTAVNDGNGNIVVIIIASEVNYTGTYTETLKANGPVTTEPPQTQPTTAAKTVPVNKVKLNKPKNIKKKAVQLTWKKLTGVKGYQIRYATKKSMKKAKKKLIKKNKNKYTLKKLELKKTYFIQVRAYVVVNGKKDYGEWSAKKRIAIKQ